MDKRPFLHIGDRIVTKKFGRWTIADITADGFLVLVKVRKGKVTETFKIRAEHLFS